MAQTIPGSWTGCLQRKADTSLHAQQEGSQLWCDVERISREGIQGANCFVSANTSPLALELVSCTIRARGQSLPIQSPQNSIILLRSISRKQSKARFAFTPQISA